MPPFPAFCYIGLALPCLALHSSTNDTQAYFSLMLSTPRSFPAFRYFCIAFALLVRPSLCMLTCHPTPQTIALHHLLVEAVPTPLAVGIFPKKRTSGPAHASHSHHTTCVSAYHAQDAPLLAFTCRLRCPVAILPSQQAARDAGRSSVLCGPNAAQCVLFSLSFATPHVLQ